MFEIGDLLKLIGLISLWLLGGLLAWGIYELLAWILPLPPEAFLFGVYVLGVAVIGVSVWSIYLDFRTASQRKAAIRSRNAAERLRRTGREAIEPKWECRA